MPTAVSGIPLHPGEPPETQRPGLQPLRPAWAKGFWIGMTTLAFFNVLALVWVFFKRTMDENRIYDNKVFLTGGLGLSPFAFKSEL